MNLFEFQQLHDIKEHIQFDGQVHRYKKHSQKQKNSWYIGFSHYDNGKEFQYLLAGDWSTGERNTWKSYEHTEYDDTFRAKVQESKEAAEKEKAVLNKEAAKKAAWFWTEAGELNPLENPYMQAKGLSKSYGLKYFKGTHGNSIVIPRYNISGEITSVQRIFDDGSKRFLKDGEIKGTFFTINPRAVEDVESIYICEGFATGATCSEVLEGPVVVAFDAGNLEAVYLVVKERFPKADIMVLADNDQFNKYNAGLDKAYKLFVAHGVPYFYPEFDSNDGYPTDFNDLYMNYGMDEVKRQLYMKPKKASKSYLDFKLWTDAHYKTMRRCPMSDTAYYKDRFKQWIPIENSINIMKSLAPESLLDPTKVEPHLSRYIDSMEKRFLFDAPEYQNEDPIGQMFKRLYISNINHDYAEELFKEWAGKVFSKARDSRNQNTVTILQGNQGIGKDSFLQHMFSSLSLYFSDIPVSEKLKEIAGDIAGLLIGNIPEFDETHKTSISTIKTLITTPRLNYRTPYAKKATFMDMRTSFVSSCNLEDILRDSTGNRRFTIFEVEKIIWTYKQVNPDQILAQMIELDRVKYKASKEAHKAMDEYLNEKTPDDTNDLIIEELADRLKALYGISTDPEIMTWPYVSSLAEAVSKKYRVGIKRIQGLMRKHFQKVQKVEGKACRLYLPKAFQNIERTPGVLNMADHLEKD